MKRRTKTTRPGPPMSEPEGSPQPVNQWELFTVAEIASEDKTSEKTVRRDIKAGRLKVLRLGKNGRIVRVTAEERLRYRNARRG